MTPASLLKFLNAARSLAKQGFKQEDIIKFAKQEFGEVTDLVRLQINKIFKTKNQPSVGIKTKDPVFDNTVETIPFDDTGTPFNPRDPQKVYGKPKEVDTGSPFEDYRRNVLGEGKNKPLDPDDVLPNYNETPGEFARRQTPGSKENILEQMKAAYPQRYNNLTGNETAAELKGIMEKANKTDVPFSTTSEEGTIMDRITAASNRIKEIQKEQAAMYKPKVDTTPESEKIVGNILDDTNLDDLFDEAGNLNKDAVLKAATKKPKNRSMTADELEDFEMEIGDSLEGYDFDGTVEDGARILREQKKYTDDMFAQYKAEGGSKRLGGPKDPMADAIDNASPGYTGDLKYDAQLVADDLAEKMYGVEYDDLTQAQQMDLYDKAYTALSKNQQTLKGIKNTGKIDISDPNVADDFTNFIKKNDPDGYKDLEQKITLSNAKKPKDRKDNSKGGRIKMAKGGLPNILGF